MIIFFLINLNMCFGCSKEPSQYVLDEKLKKIADRPDNNDNKM